MKSKRVLVAPMDWGLGHATRCIPVIQELLSASCEVTLAGSGRSLILLQHEFPSLPFVVLPAYNPVYPSSGAMVFKMILQLPKFINVINNEHRIVNQFIQENKIDIIISDNRYGCWSNNAISIFITHQVNILMPKGWTWLGKFINRFNHKQIQKFKACWIPDHADEQNLSGILSIPSNLQVKYIGPLSRFKRSSIIENELYDVMVILSGPEPQRTLFEKLMIDQLSTTQLSAVIVRGLPEQSGITMSNRIKIIDFLNGHKLQQIIGQSNIIISRSGYSSVMDLLALGKRAIFIPTPGQTEQAYLAERMEIKRIAYFASQFEFEIDSALKKAKDYTGFHTNRNNLLQDAILELIN